MKPRKKNLLRQSYPLIAGLNTLLSLTSIHAQNLYWDQNGTTSGFGTASTANAWQTNTVSRWSTSAAGTGTPGASITTSTSNILNFGADTAGTGLGGGTISVVGTVNAGTLRFGSQTTGNILITGGTINLAAAATIHVGAGGTTVHTIASTITGAGTSLTKTGNALQLSANNSFTGQTIISAGTLILNSATALGGDNPGVNGTSSISMGAGTILQSNYIINDAGNVDSFVYAPITLTAAGTNRFLIGAGNSTAPAEAVTFNINGAISTSGTGNTNVAFGNTTASRNNADSIIVLRGASTYNGTTTIQAGNAQNRINVRAGVANALPITTILGFDVMDGSGTGRTTQFDLNGNNQTLAGLENGGTVGALRNIRVNNTGALATLTINGTANSIFGGANGGQNAQIIGAIALTKNGAGTFTLAAGAGNAFTGDTKVLGGILVLGQNNSIQNSAFDTEASITGDSTNGLRLGVGGTGVTTLTLGGLKGNKNFADVITTTTGGYGNLTALTLNPGSGNTASYSGNIGDGAGGMTLTKSGEGTQTLAGVNTHTGGTTINAGTLAVSGGNALPDTGLVTLANVAGASLQLTSNETIGHLTGGGLLGGTVDLGANTLTLGDATNQTFAGTITGAGSLNKQGSGVLNLTGAASNITLTQGTLTGSSTIATVNVGAGTGGILSNNNGVAGAALTIGDLTFNGGATVNTFANSAAAPIVTTNLATNVAGNVTINASSTAWANGLNSLISYGGGSIGGAGFGQFTLGTVTGLGGRQTVGSLSDTGTAVALTINGDTTVWTGVNGAAWTTTPTNDPVTGTPNWSQKIATAGSDFWSDDLVEFNDTYNVGGGSVAVTQTSVDISTADVSPKALLFNNSAVNYTLGSTGGFGIAGTTGLTKSGTGTLTITHPNTYSGVTSLNGGTLQIDNASALGSGTISFGGGVLRYGTGITTDLSARFSTAASQAYRVNTNGNVVTYGTALTSVGGTLTKEGAGTLILTANNSSALGLTVNGGILQATKNATVGSVVNALGTGAINVGSSGTFVVDVTKITNVTDTISNTFTGTGTLKLQFADNPTARNTNLSGVSGFDGTIQLSSIGTTNDKWNAASLGTVNGSLLIDSGNTIFVATAPASFTGGITMNGAGNSDGRGAIRISGTTLGGNIRLASSSTISMEGSFTAAVTGNITSGAEGSQTLTLGGASATGGTLSGNIGGGTGTLNGITVATGFYTLSGTNNTYTGITNISAAGRGIIVGANNALGAVGAGNETTVFGAGAGNGGQLGFLGGVNYSAEEKIIGSGNGSTGSSSSLFSIASRGFIQAVGTGTATFAGPVELNADGTSRIGTQDGARLVLTGPITQGTGITTANLIFRTGNTNGDFVTLSNTSNSFGGNSTVFTSLAVDGQYAGLRLGADNAHPTNLTVSNFSSASGSSTAFDLNGKQQTLNGLVSGGAGTLKIINLDTANASTLTLNPSANVTNGANISILGGSPGGTPLGMINVVKNGTFTQTLAGTHSYTGTTLVNGGTLLVNGSTSTGDVTVASTGTLGGSGTIGGATTIQSGGTHAPGNSPGLQTFSSDLSYSSGSTFAWDLAANVNGAGGTRGTSFDAVNVTGNLTISGGAVFNVIQNAGVDFANSFWDTNQTWSNIWNVTGTTTSGWTSTAVAVYNESNVLQNVSARGSFSITGTTLTWTAVPEASNLLIGGLIGLGLMARRRKNA